MSGHTDIDLWQNLKSGDRHSFNQLFRQYYSQLYCYGIKIYPDSDFVKECIQEVFIRIWETRMGLGEVLNVKSYLIISLRRKILSTKTKFKSEPIYQLSQAENYAFLFDVNEFEKHDEISDEIRQTLISAINSITRKQRELIMLFFYHELSYAEISQVMGISIQAARNLMYRTLTHLRKSIGKGSLESIKNQFFLLFSSVLLKKM